MNFHVITTTNRPERHLHIQDQVYKWDDYMIVWHSHPMPKREDRCANLFESMAMSVINSYEQPYCVIIEDDHFFTEKFNPELLEEYIRTGEQAALDILLGGVEYFTGGQLAVEQQDPFLNIVTVDNFVGTQFMVIYKKFYDAFVQMDHRICPEESLSLRSGIRKGVCYPFISMQADFNSAFGRPAERHRAFIEGELKMAAFYQKNKSNGIHDRR